MQGEVDRTAEAVVSHRSWIQRGRSIERRNLLLLPPPLAAAAIASLLLAGAGIATILFITKMMAIPARLFSVAGCRMGRHGAGEGRLPGSRPKGAHPRWVAGSWGSPSGVSRRLSEHGIAPSGNFATAHATRGKSRGHGRVAEFLCNLFHGAPACE